jgi:beta-lactamase regulating signal transducer with metallopeptidase domain
MIKCYLYLRAVFKKDIVLINQRAVWEMHMIRVIALEAPMSNAWSTQSPADTVSVKASPCSSLP